MWHTKGQFATLALSTDIRSGGLPMAQTPEYWRARAEESRALAESMKNPRAAQTMREIAKGYENLAEMAKKEKPDGLGTRHGKP